MLQGLKVLFFSDNDSVAQLVEHIPFKDGVLGSSPSWITEKFKFYFSIGRFSSSAGRAHPF
jgi:hypothetical protein